MLLRRVHAWNWTLSLKPTLVNQLHQQSEGKSIKTYSGKLSRFSHPTPSPQTPPGQAVGRKHGNCLRSRTELLTCFLELSHDWDSFHISTRELVSLHEHDLNSVTYISFQAKKNCLINPRQLECEATLPEPFMQKARCLGGICHQFLFCFLFFLYVYELRFLEVIH